jgi:hypothetical protein
MPASLPSPPSEITSRRSSPAPSAKRQPWKDLFPFPLKDPKEACNKPQLVLCSSYRGEDEIRLMAELDDKILGG